MKVNPYINGSQEYNEFNYKFNPSAYIEDFIKKYKEDLKKLDNFNRNLIEFNSIKYKLKKIELQNMRKPMIDLLDYRLCTVEKHIKSIIESLKYIAKSSKIPLYIKSIQEVNQNDKPE